MKIYCSGIGGIGLSAYAALQNAAGHDVYGSDRSASELVEDLRSQGIDVSLDQDGSHIPLDSDLFVYSEAIPEDAPERVRATELGIRQISYFAALGELSKDYRVIAVSGTHGKSSTTAMAARVLIEAGLDPSVVVGTKIKELDGRNWRKGESDLFLLEACEYRHSFHYLSPNVVLLSSVDGDHFDFYESVEMYQQAYIDFLKKLPSDGVVITHGGDGDCVKVVEVSGKEMIDVDGKELPKLSTPGRHMQENAQLVLGLSDVLGIDEADARASLSGYTGSWRRLEVKGEFEEGITIIDDYGHHPLEVKANLEALKGAYPDRRLVCVFQPHTHERSISLYGDFLTAFNNADFVILTDVYEARSDIENEKVDIEKYVSDIAMSSGVECVLGGSLEDTEKLVRSSAQPGDVVVCMGAGTITNLAHALVNDQ